MDYKEKEYEQYLKEEEAIKNKQMYDFEQREKDRLARPPYKKKHELTGEEEWEITLQRQRETEMLSEKKIKQENEMFEAFKESERVRRGLSEPEEAEKPNYRSKWVQALNGGKSERNEMPELSEIERKEMATANHRKMIEDKEESRKLGFIEEEKNRFLF